jgi:hypothetical protein
MAPLPKIPCLHAARPRVILVGSFEYRSCPRCNARQVLVLNDRLATVWVSPWADTAEEAEAAAKAWLDGPDSVGKLGP